MMKKTKLKKICHEQHVWKIYSTVANIVYVTFIGETVDSVNNFKIMKGETSIIIQTFIFKIHKALVYVMIMEKSVVITYMIP